MVSTYGKPLCVAFSRSEVGASGAGDGVDDGAGRPLVGGAVMKRGPEAGRRLVPATGVAMKNSEA